MYSYTSADTIPAKLLQDADLIRRIRKDTIPPVHVQLILTNKCNLKCAYCSCANDDRSMEMTWPMFADLIPRLSRIGTRAITITGGGEPLLYPMINEAIQTIRDSGISVGLVTNGIELPKISTRALHAITWCRISHSDDRPFTESYAKSLSAVIAQAPHVGWAFSYVLTHDSNLSNLTAVCRYATDHSFTHVRIVSDLTNTEQVDMSAAKAKLSKEATINHSILIYQDRTEPEPGMRCWIAYLKPTIAPDGNIYRCCGAQYALDTKQRRWPDELKMGTIATLEESLRDYSTVSQGLICNQCYYGGYNRVLEAIKCKVTHEEFV